jgi:hypothetical protein
MAHVFRFATIPDKAAPFRDLLFAFPQVSAMLFASDDDTFPIRCSFCHYEFQEKVGLLRTGAELRCPACKKILDYDVAEFLGVLEQARQNPHGVLQPFTRLRRKL